MDIRTHNNKLIIKVPDGTKIDKKLVKEINQHLKKYNVKGNVFIHKNKLKGWIMENDLLKIKLFENNIEEICL